MGTVLGAVLGLLLGLAWPTAVWAAGGDGGSSLSSFIYQVVNLVLILGVLFFVARKPVAKYFASRAEQIKTDVESAAELLAEAESRNAETQQRLEDLGAELDKIRETVRRRAEHESEEILKETQKRVERIQVDASAAIEQELLRSRRFLKAEAADLAIELAADLLKEKVSDVDRDQLLDEFITRIEAGSEPKQPGH